MALRPWEVSRLEISVKPEPSIPRGSQNWLGSCYKPEYLVLSGCGPCGGYLQLWLAVRVPCQVLGSQDIIKNS